MMCPTCGPIEHQRIPDDRQHCSCDLGVIKRRTEYGEILVDACDCECHA